MTVSRVALRLRRALSLRRMAKRANFPMSAMTRSQSKIPTQSSISARPVGGNQEGFLELDRSMSYIRHRQSPRDLAWAMADSSSLRGSWLLVLAARWPTAPLGTHFGHPGGRSSAPPPAGAGQPLQTQNGLFDSLAFLLQVSKNLHHVHRISAMGCLFLPYRP